MGLTPGSYEAYCLDQAIWYVGTTITNEVENAGQKKDSKTIATEQARKRALMKIIDGPEAKGLYADPAAMFG